MKKHIFTVKHDNGKVKITTWGYSSIESATKFIMELEKCPKRAIIKVIEKTI